MVYKYGGAPIGSFKWTSSTQKLSPGTAHALFIDSTHDNPSPVEKKTVQDMLPSAALVSMAACAVGSNPGSRKDKTACQWENESQTCPSINRGTYYPTLPNNHVSLHF